MSCLQQSLSGFSCSVYRRCCDTDEYRERANNMTIPAKGWLVLHWVPGKHLPQHSDQLSGNASNLAFRGGHSRGILVGIAVRSWNQARI